MEDSEADVERRHGLTLDQLEQQLSEIADYQISQGSLLKIVSEDPEATAQACSIPVSVVPTYFPRQLFQHALDLQKAMNELYVRVASDEQWLEGVVQPLLEHDQLARALWNVHLRSKQVKYLRSAVKADEDSFVCGIFRSDYMLHQPAGEALPCLKQVEMNTFSCSGACHSEKVAKMHTHLHRARELEPSYSTCLPTDNATANIVELLKQARRAFRPLSKRRACVLMVVQPLNFNIVDERPIEYALWDEGIPCYRCEWLNVLDQTVLADDGSLLFTPTIAGGLQYEVAVVYYRAGYEAVEYHDKGQETRLRLDSSRAINCPDVLTHLATFKAIQQALTKLDAIERYLGVQMSARVRETFMEMRVLGDSTDGIAARELATNENTAGAYILKPNLEGGSHNVYGEDIPDFLLNIPEVEWRKYILMRKIEPPDVQGLLMSPEGLYDGSVISELGVLGGVLWRKGRDNALAREVISNDVLGWTFKTKPKDINEMSVVKGFGCFDCPRLVDTLPSTA